MAKRVPATIRRSGRMLVSALAMLVVFGVYPSQPVTAAGKFIDDDGNTHEGNIEVIAAAGITKGCNPPTNNLYCPSHSVTRGQMAAFLRRALDLPAVATDRFRDDDTSIFEADIDAIAAERITLGCNPPTNDRFCPNDVVTRAQMAAFLVRAFDYQSDGTDKFVDDEGSIFEDDINKLAAARVTLGCNPPTNDRFCPNDPVKRDQMASFLARALGVAVSEPPPPDTGFQPAAPIRAAFFYPWFPEAWDQSGIDPFTNYTPSLGFYDSENHATIDQQLELAERAGIEAFIASWWGVGHHTDTALDTLLDRTTRSGSPYANLRWAIYYEEEGQSDPSVATILSDLAYLETNYFGRPGYLRVDGKPVVFVWADSGDGAGMASRWAQAKASFGDDLFVVLKVFDGFKDDPNQPDSWHQYGPSTAYQEHLPYSAVVSPGFWLVGEDPRLERDATRFADDVAAMTGSGAFWQLVTTWNEWGEGTSVEPAEEFGEVYIDILADSKAVSFAAAGDHGATDDTDASLAALAQRPVDFYLALGDMSYSDLEPESAWCDYVTSYVGSTFPFELIVGNHEDDDLLDGYIGDFAACLPDRMGAVGTYGAEYYFDVDGLVRVIMIGAGNDVEGIKYDYEVGNARYQWLSATIDGAADAGIPWVVVGMHKVCITAGNKDCEIGAELPELLIAKGVDLVLQGHDHDYQRSKQLDCLVVDSYDAGCVTDSGADGNYPKDQGTVFVVAGTFGGGGLTPIDSGDSEYGYFAETMGGGDSDAGRGFVEITVTADTLVSTFIGTTSSYTDSFTID